MRSDSVLKLGEKIVDELGLDQSVDTLGRWMAHYIAEKIADVEAASGEDREKKMSICAEAILNLWAHRSELPSGKRPFEEFESVFRALQSLDLDDTTPRFFRQIRLAADENDESSETAKWLNLATGIDNSARVLIRYCITEAVKTVVDKSKNWVALADAVGKSDEYDVSVVIKLIEDAETVAPKTTKDVEREKIKVLADKLETFAEMANQLSLHFTKILKNIDESTD